MYRDRPRTKPVRVTLSLGRVLGFTNQQRWTRAQTRSESRRRRDAAAREIASSCTRDAFVSR